MYKWEGFMHTYLLFTSCAVLLAQHLCTVPIGSQGPSNSRQGIQPFKGGVSIEAIAERPRVGLPAHSTSPRSTESLVYSSELPTETKHCIADCEAGYYSSKRPVLTNYLLGSSTNKVSHAVLYIDFWFDYF